jgi:photosystem II stability/assembly factor-like uncharacterized protein
MRKFILSSLIAFAAHSSFAQWQEIKGPSQSVLKGIWSFGNDLAAATDDSVFLYIDSTDDWSAFSISPNTPTKSVVIKGQRIIAATNTADTSNAGIFISPDRGANFTRINVNEPGTKRYNFINADGTSRMILCADIDTLGTVFTSDDDGDTWTKRFSFTGSAKSIRRKPNGHYLLAGHQIAGGVWQSTDNGLSWMLISNGLPDTVLINDITALTNDVLIAVGSVGHVNMGAVYKSTDGGATWMAVHVGAANKPMLAVSFNAKGRLFIPIGSDGAITSADSGTTWTAAANLSQTYAVARQDDGTILCGNNNNIARWVGITGISDSKIYQHITVFPVPAKNYITLQNYSASANDRIMAVDVAGKAYRLNHQASNGNTEFSINTLPSGIYLLVINGRITKLKFMVE